MNRFLKTSVGVILDFNSDDTFKGERNTRGVIQFLHSGLRVITASLTNLDQTRHGGISESVHN